MVFCVEADWDTEAERRHDESVAVDNLSAALLFAAHGKPLHFRAYSTGAVGKL